MVLYASTLFPIRVSEPKRPRVSRMRVMRSGAGVPPAGLGFDVLVAAGKI
jgi:hypothetical protein